MCARSSDEEREIDAHFQTVVLAAALVGNKQLERETITREEQETSPFGKEALLQSFSGH